MVRHAGQQIIAVRKLEQAQYLLATQDGLRLESAGAITRLWCDPLRAELLDDLIPRRLLSEGSVAQLDAIGPVLRAKSQTIGHFGLAPRDIAALVARSGTRGCQRIVPLGRANGIFTHLGRARYDPLAPSRELRSY